MHKALTSQFRQHLFFKFLMRFEKFRHPFLIKEVSNLAEGLFDNVFPMLQAQQKKRYVCRIDGDRFVGTDIFSVPALPQCPKLIQFLKENTIKTVVFDNRLEKNQIIESFIVLIHASKQLRSSIEGDAPFYITDSVLLAQALLNKKGLQRFCAQIRLDKYHETFEITYSYCELFYTYSLKQFLQKLGQPFNHRSLFSFAPWAGLSAFLLLFFHIWFWGSASPSELLAGLFASAILGLTVTYFLQTLASTVYDKEHQEVLLKQGIQEITALSHFPNLNPNPIIKTDKHGTIVFHNPATTTLLKKMAGKTQSPKDLLPEEAQTIIKECLASNSTYDIEASRYDRELRYSISPFQNEEAVFWAITDITRLKRLEQALRVLNQSLETKVQERTRELEATRDVTILTLSSLAETRDPDTGAHLNRTRLYVKTLAEELRKNSHYSSELDDKSIDLLYRSAPLHDIGKVGIADSILLKPGPLTAEEFELMKEHPRLGGDSLKLAEKELGSNAFLRSAWEIAYYHHEKWDGSGYIFGLKGEEIPLSSRLMALADVYDALTTKRVYKEAYSHEKSRAIILEGKGTHFDPAIVDAFLAREDTFIEIAQKYAE